MSRFSIRIWIFILGFTVITEAHDLNIDDNGYIAFCPCMGRFGNQADHFLGALAFAHDLNRTLILPPWVEYRTGYAKSVQVPFDNYFKVASLQQYHRVILMGDFMKNLAPIVWPREERIAFCYRNRGSEGSCNAKEGNPFGPFWDTYNIDFVKSEFYGPLHYDTHHHNMAEEWHKRYPANEFPVLAFTGAPASFPVQKENKVLQKYLVWSDLILKKAQGFIKNVLPSGPFIGIHLRNGIDWGRACDHIKGNGNMFAAPQCLGYKNEHGHATYELCFPPIKSILRDLRKVVKKLKAKTVFVASDNNHMLKEIESGLKDLNVKAFKQEVNEPHVDLAILGLSNHLIANCISSYSSFAKRERDVNSLPSSFWEFPLKEKHDEL